MKITQLWTDFVNKVSPNSVREQSVVTVPTKTPEEVFQEIQTLSTSRKKKHDLCSQNILSLEEDNFKTPWAKKECEKETQKLLKEYISEVDKLNNLSEQYRLYLRTLPDGEAKFEKWGKIIQGEKDVKADLIKDVHEVLGIYNGRG